VTGSFGFQTEPGTSLKDYHNHTCDVVVGYGTDVDLDVIRAWWSLRSLQAARRLVEHGFDPATPGREFDVLRSAVGLMQPHIRNLGGVGERYNYHST
jgi:hypothetical protein